MKLNKNNIQGLHIIRGLAALMVAIAHSKWPFWVGGTAFLQGKSFGELGLSDKIGFGLAMLSSNGTAMVIIFFVLSGFLITYSFSNNKWSYKEFLMNRAIRIYTPFFASMLLAWGLLIVVFKMSPGLFQHSSDDFNNGVYVAYSQGLTASNLIKTLFFIRSDANYLGFNFVYWSLLYESMFYILAPLLIRYYFTFSILAILLFPLQFYLSLDEMNFFYVHFFTRYLLFFMMGIWLFKYLSAGKLNLRFGGAKFFILLLVFLFIISVVVSLTFNKRFSFLFAGILATFSIYYVIKFEVKSKILNRGLIWLGEISYSLYLIHIPLYILFYSLAYCLFKAYKYHSPWVHYLPVLFVLPVAAAFYYLIEEKSLRLIKKRKKHFQENKKAEVAQTLAAP